MTDPLIEQAERHIANDATAVAALHAVARKADNLLGNSDPKLHGLGVTLWEIVMPALVCIGEVLP